MGNHPLAAVVSALALRRRWWAVRGHRAFCDGARLRVSQASVLAASFICHSNLFWPRPPEDLFNGMTHDPASGTVERRLRSLYGPDGRGWRRDRCGGHAGRQALGSRAISLIVEEAGGRVTDFDGAVRPTEGPLVASNRVLHDEILATLRGSGDAQRGCS
jgi:histidinol-phosphatase